MNDLIYWLLMALIQLIIYLLPSISLPKGKWIRKKDTASVSSTLSISGDSKPFGQSRSNSKEIVE